jgi:cohesin complex subunit SA-1/2
MRGNEQTQNYLTRLPPLDDCALISAPTITKPMPSQRLPLMELSENDAPSSNATAKRRVSGRAVRAPEKFVPDAPSSQAGNTSGKRKRGANHAEEIENEVDEDQEESDEEDNDEESPDEEEVRQAKKKAKPTKKPVAKKAKVNGTAPDAPDAPATTVKLPSRQKKPKKVVIQDAKAEGLYGEHIIL